MARNRVHNWSLVTPRLLGQIIKMAFQHRHVDSVLATSPSALLHCTFEIAPYTQEPCVELSTSSLCRVSAFWIQAFLLHRQKCFADGVELSVIPRKAINAR